MISLHKNDTINFKQQDKITDDLNVQRSFPLIHCSALQPLAEDA